MKPQKSPRILLVDDHEMLRRGVEAIIRRNSLGKLCGEAQNGEEAIRKVQELKPDLVIMDVSMPVMGGLEAAREIRRIAPATKIIILTMHNSAQIAEAVHEVGADALVVKTEAAANLADVIRDIRC
jgi:DNA-binding NarL/FixJ family response regulator